jgi:hypothetical protein
VVLGTPPVILSLAVTHLIPRFWPACAPLVGWDRVASFALLGSLGVVALGALGVNVTRLVLAGLAAVALAMYVVAPNAILGILPILALLACPRR